MFSGLNRLIKIILPKRLFYRALIIVAAPTIILQVIITIVFYDSIWIKANKGMTRSIVSEIKTLFDVCEYPEGIDISYTQNLIVVACWFEDNIILINLNDFSVKKKIEPSGGPRAFGRFIIKK